MLVELVEVVVSVVVVLDPVSTHSKLSSKQSTISTPRVTSVIRSTCRQSSAARLTSTCKPSAAKQIGTRPWSSTPSVLVKSAQSPGRAARHVGNGVEVVEVVDTVCDPVDVVEPPSAEDELEVFEVTDDDELVDSPPFVKVLVDVVRVVVEAPFEIDEVLVVVPCDDVFDTEVVVDTLLLDRVEAVLPVIDVVKPLEFDTEGEELLLEVPAADDVETDIDVVLLDVVGDRLASPPSPA